MQARFQSVLQREFDRRREANRRYSLRAFATFLGADHSTLSQILRGRRRIPAPQLRQWAKRLGLDREEAAAYIIAERLPDSETAARSAQLAQWSAEASAVITGREHWQIVSLSRTPGFQTDARWIAERIGFTVDEVNVAFTRLLRLRLMETGCQGGWIVAPGTKAKTESEFRRLALARVRERAAEFDIKLPRATRKSDS